MGYEFTHWVLSVESQYQWYGIGSSMSVVLVLIFVNMVQHVFVRWTKKWPFFIVDFENVVVAWIPEKMLHLITL